MEQLIPCRIPDEEELMEMSKSELISFLQMTLERLNYTHKIANENGVKLSWNDICLGSARHSFSNK